MTINSPPPLSRWQAATTVLAALLAGAMWVVATQSREIARQVVAQDGYSRAEGEVLGHRVNILEEWRREESHRLKRLTALQEQTLDELRKLARKER